MTPYGKTWLKSLPIMPLVVEPWHLDVIQAQFIDGEARKARASFRLRHVAAYAEKIGVKVSVAMPDGDDEDRAAIVAEAARILRKHGREPRVNRLWFAVD